MPLDPIRTTQAITDSYINYLATTFRMRDPNLQSKLEGALSTPDRFVKGPILEATPPFAAGDSLQNLIDKGVLATNFGDLVSPRLPLTRPLYRHQDQAIRRVVQDGRNVVVATGTGSGKTESFLVPILDRLIRENTARQLGPGVRALLLYPMNALANDQVARLSEILSGYPAIIFGRYTGETQKDLRDALQRYRKMYHRDPLPNELIAREQMWQQPPHILLTNYAMLEYLLLRPGDSIFFDGEFAQHWRFIVIDEAHTYTGAKGIEMAMLLRRLKDRVVASEPDRLRCIATSATLGRGVDDYPDVARFAQGLFGETFEWAPDDPTRQDVISATRKPLTPQGEMQWLPSPDIYRRWQTIVDEDLEFETARKRLIDTGATAGIPETSLKEMRNPKWTATGPLLYEGLKGDARLLKLRTLLTDKPAYVRDLAQELFGESDRAYDTLVDLVDLAARARPANDDAPLIPARYHLFVRAVEGAYLALHPSRPLYLERQEQVTIDEKSYAVFELATCRQCGATYLVGEHEDSHGRERLRQPGHRYFEDTRALRYYLLSDENGQVPEDDDEVVGFGAEKYEIEGDRYQLCVHCGAIDRDNLLMPLCNCQNPARVTLVSVSAKTGLVYGCPACGARSPTGLVWRFLTGNDATASVLATAFYQQIPLRSVSEQPAAIVHQAPDDWGSTAVRRENTLVNQGRQMLVFSDSRQDAAFFAPYLSRTYWQILRRRAIIQTLHNNKSTIASERWRVQDIILPLLATARSHNLLAGTSAQEHRREIWQWMLYELMALDRRNSLEGLGCLGFSLIRPNHWQPPGPLLRWGLEEHEVWTLFQVLLDGFRAKGALLFPEFVSPEDEFFKPRNFEAYFRQNGSSARRHIFAWSPAKGVMNARIDYLLRLTQRLDQPLAYEGAATVLDQIWGRSLELHNPASCWRPYFSSVSLRDEGVVYRMKPDFWELRATDIDPSVQWYYCDTCHNLALHNLHGTCPTYQCRGSLTPCDPGEILGTNHYRRLYSHLEPIPLKAEEHTAQLTADAAAELQTRFVSGEVNVLSCSTTFELGVDVGELESVLMRNVPPSAANYIQRAGRAGRRTESTAFALTFAQRRSHDLSHFIDPMRMVAGKIGAPHFEVANEKIVLRHVFATALASFWRAFPDTFGRVEDFFFRTGSPGQDLVRNFLENRPPELQASLRRIVPDGLRRQLGIEDWTWQQQLTGDEGALTRATSLAISEVAQLDAARQRRISENKPSDYVLRFINTIKQTYLLSYLSRQNVIPKYGFPVDVVSLQILHHGDEAKSLELDRDLRIALSEYAPGSQVVAGGKLWTSRYLKLLPERIWPRYEYAVCDNCQRYQSVISDDSATLTHCCACEKPLHGRMRGTFVIPEFGFMTAAEPPGQPGDSRPTRSYSSRTHFSGEPNPGEPLEVALGYVTLVATPASDAQLAVINSASGIGFRICHRCGYTQRYDEPLKSPHDTPWGGSCRGTMKRYHLGHEFKTDILQLRFQGYLSADLGFWQSLLYALLEGASKALDIDRDDLDGCLYPWAGDPSRPALILYDEVPGGAGHVKRIGAYARTLTAMLEAAVVRLESCECGMPDGLTSCYGCLRNYRNQFCHDSLQRGPVIRFLRSIMD